MHGLRNEWPPSSLVICFLKNSLLEEGACICIGIFIRFMYIGERDKEGVMFYKRWAWHKRL